MPITSPRMLMSGLPELPGLMAASVLMNGTKPSPGNERRMAPSPNAATDWRAKWKLSFDGAGYSQGRAQLPTLIRLHQEDCRDLFRAPAASQQHRHPRHSFGTDVRTPSASPAPGRRMTVRLLRLDRRRHASSRCDAARVLSDHRVAFTHDLGYSPAPCG